MRESIEAVEEKVRMIKDKHKKDNEQFIQSMIERLVDDETKNQRNWVE